MSGKREDRVDRIVTDLLRGRRLKLRGGDADEKEAITMAARLSGARHGPERMSPAFRKALEARLDRVPQEGYVTRRMALVAGLGLAAGAATGGLLERTLAEPAATGAAGGGAIEPTHGVWTDVAALDELGQGEAKRVTAGSVSAYVIRRGDNVTAVSSICSHLPCELSWDGANNLLTCPCHNATFTTDGKSTSTAYPLPALNSVHARVTPEGRVEVLGTA